MAAYYGLPECFWSDSLGNPYTVPTTAEAVGMASTKTVEVMGDALVARKRKRVFRRQTLALEFGVFRKAYSIYLSPSITCVLSISVNNLNN